MKRKLSLLLCLLFAVFAFPSAARADLGPKPSLEITFSGLEGETYYVGLLGYEPGEDTPFAMRPLREALIDGDAVDDEAILQKFAAYQDADGLVALDSVENCSESHYYSAGRFPPASFKVLIYFPESDHFVVSDRIYTSSAFYASYHVDAAGIGLTKESSGGMDLALRSTYQYGSFFLKYLLRLFLTLSVELLLAGLFRLLKPSVFRLILLVNLITQTLLTLTLAFVDYSDGLFAVIFWYFVLETAVFLAEAIVYQIGFKRLGEGSIRPWKAWVYAWVANTASFFTGIVLYLTIV